VQDVLAASPEARCAIGHDTLALGGADLAAQVGLARLAELALAALRRVESNNMVANLDVGDTLADRLDDASALVSQNDREGALGILARERVCVCVADASVVDLDADLMGPRRKHLNILVAELLARGPGNGRLALDDLDARVSDWRSRGGGCVVVDYLSLCRRHRFAVLGFWFEKGKSQLGRRGLVFAWSQ